LGAQEKPDDTAGRAATYDLKKHSMEEEQQRLRRELIVRIICVKIRSF